MSAVALGAIAVDQASIRFPDSNDKPTNSGASFSYLTAPSPSPTTGTWFNTDQAFIFSLELPYDEMDGIGASAVYGVLGNSGAGASARTFGFTLGGKKHTTLAGKLRAVFNSESAASTDWFSGDIDVSGIRRMVVSFRAVGSTFYYDVYSRGVLIGQVTKATGAFATSARTTANYLIGALGNSSGILNPSGSSSAYVGSIGWVGHHVGTVTDADLAALSLGIDPLAQLAAANWRQFRYLPDTSSASLAKPAAATGDATAAFTTTGTGFERGSNIVPARSGSDWFACDFIPNGRVWGLTRGATTVAVPVAGRASVSLAGAVAQVRAFDEATGQLTKDWTPVTGGTIAADGSWSGTVALPINSGWGHLDARPGTNDALKHRLRSKVGVGYALGVMGQSQMEIALTATGMGYTPPAAAAVSIAIQDRTGNDIITLKRSRPDRPVSDFAAVVGQVLAQKNITAPVALLGMVKGGSSMGDLMDDSLTARLWTDLTRMTALAGREVSVIGLNWATEDMGSGNIGSGYIIPLATGAAPSGPLAAPYTVQHHLKDGTFQSGMVVALSPVTRHTDTSKTGATDNSGGAYTGNAGKARADYYAFAASRPDAFAAMGPSLDDMAITSSGGPHQPTNVDEGPARVARRWLIATLRALSLDTTTDPSIMAATLASGGAAIEVTVSRPNGGSIQTAWAIKGVAVPSGETTVQGFEVSTDGGTTWSRSGFTAEIVDAAAGTVRLTKASGTWAAGTRLRYLANGPLDYGLPTEAQKLYHGMLYESGPLEGGLGLPVRGLYAATLAA